MGSPRILSFLLLSCFLLLSLSHGFGVEVVMKSMEHEGYISSTAKESAGKCRKMMIEVMDYADPGPNTNTRSGYLSPPPPPPA